MNDFRVGGVLVTILVHGIVVLLLVGFGSSGNAEAGRTQLSMTTIEASLAYRAKEPPKQPQKRRQPKPPPVDAPTVSRDENHQVKPKDDKPPEPKEDFEKDFEKYMKQRQTEDDDIDPGEEAPKPGGEFNGSEHGFAEESKGDPYFQELAAQVYASWTVPTLEKGAGTAAGCVRIGPDGRVVETKLLQSAQNANIDRSVKVALKSVQELRDKDAKPVPQHLVNETKHWICFNLSVEKSS